jgi:transposase
MPPNEQNAEKFDFSVDVVLNRLLEENDTKAKKRLVALREYMAGYTAREIEERYGFNRPTVYSWLNAFREKNDFIDALYDDAQGRPATEEDIMPDSGEIDDVLKRFEPYESRETGNTLIDSEIYYIRSRTQDSKTTQSNFSAQIEAKLEKLPERITNLTVDIALFQWYLHFSEQDIPEELWDETLCATFTKLHRSVPEGRYVAPTNDHPEFLLGYNLGTVLRFLLKSSPGRSNDWYDEQMQLLSGTIFGTLGYSETELREEQSAIDTLTTYLPRHQQLREENRDVVQARFQQLADRFTDERTEEFIQAELDKSGLPDDEILVTAIRKSVNEADFAQAKQQIETTIKQLSETFDQERYQQLAEPLQEDMQTIDAASCQSIETLPLLKELYENGGSAREFEERYKPKKVTDKQITANLNRLSYSRRGDTWTNYSVVRCVDKAENAWELTPYGSLLTTMRFDNRDFLLLSLCIFQLRDGPALNSIFQLLIKSEQFITEEETGDFEGGEQFTIEVGNSTTLDKERYSWVRERLYADRKTISESRLDSSDGHRELTAGPILKALRDAKGGLSTTELRDHAYQQAGDHDGTKPNIPDLKKLLCRLSHQELRENWTKHSAIYKIDETWHLSPYGLLLTKLFTAEITFNSLDYYPLYAQVINAEQFISEQEQ